MLAGDNSCTACLNKENTCNLVIPWEIKLTANIGFNQTLGMSLSQSLQGVPDYLHPKQVPQPVLELLKSGQTRRKCYVAF